MIRVVKNYLWDSGGLYLIFVFAVGGYSLSKYIIPGSQVYASSILLLFMYFDMFMFKDKPGSKPLDRHIPMGQNKIWFSKMMTFYFMMLSIFSFYTWILVRQGEQLNSAINEASLSALIVYTCLSALSRLDLFKSKNNKYRYSAISSLILIGITALSYTKMIDILNLNTSDRTQGIELTMLHIAGIIGVSVIDFLLSRMKR